MVVDQKCNACHKSPILLPFGPLNRSSTAIILAYTVAPNVHTYASHPRRDVRVISARVQKISCCWKIGRIVAPCRPVGQITSPVRRLYEVMALAVIRIRIVYRPLGVVMDRAIVRISPMKLAVRHVGRICLAVSRANVSIRRWFVMVQRTVRMVMTRRIAVNDLANFSVPSIRYVIWLA